MKKLYFLNEEESKRILNLHKEATKNQYLINETLSVDDSKRVAVNYESKTLTLNNYLELENKQGGDELKLNKGVVFTVKDTDTLIAKNTSFQIVGDFTGSVSENGKGDVEYSCKSKEFKIIGRDLTYYNENFPTNSFNDLCSSSSTPSQSGVTSSVKGFEKFPCIPSNPKAKQGKMSDGSVSYTIDGVVYYDNGRKKLADGTMANYTCKTNTGIKKKSGSTVKQITTPSDADLDAVLGKL